eukprot:3662804-Rhodomonas_salina.5
MRGPGLGCDVYEDRQHRTELVPGGCENTSGAAFSHRFRCELGVAFSHRQFHSVLLAAAFLPEGSRSPEALHSGSHPDWLGNWGIAASSLPGTNRRCIIDGHRRPRA